MLLLSPLFFGFLAATGALLGELFAVSFYAFTIESMEFLFLSAVLEEGCKYVLLKKTLSPETSMRQLLLFLLFFSLGFGGFEISLLLLTDPLHDASLAAHAFGIFLLHSTTVFLLGYGLSKLSNKRLLPIFIIAAILIHAMYNTIILYQDILHI